MADLIQHRDVDVRIFGMVELDNGDHGLASAQVPEQSPTHWDVMVDVRDPEAEGNSIPLLEISDIASTDQLAGIAAQLERIFPDMHVETL